MPGYYEETPVISTTRAYVEVLLVFVAVFGASIGLAAASLANDLPAVKRLTWGEGISDGFGELTSGAIIVTLVVLVCRRRGVSTRDLGWRLPVNVAYLPRWTYALRAAAVASFALIAGALVTGALETGKNNLQVISGSGLAEEVGASINAGVVEEFVALAFVVVTLRQARRPVWEIGLVAVALRMTYHIYYGPGVLGVAVWATAFFIIFWTTRSVIALVVVHIAWDAFAFFYLAYGKSVSTAEFLLIGAVWYVSVILWLADRIMLWYSRRSPRARAGPSPPGRYLGPP